MHSVHLIERHFRQHRLDLLLDGMLTANLGWPLGEASPSLPLRLRLLQSQAGLLGLALRRLTELTYGPTTLSRDMTAALLEMRAEDGSFGHEVETRNSPSHAATIPDPLATAVAAAALGAMQRQWRASPSPQVAAAHHTALAALGGMQVGDGLFACPADRNTGERELTAAAILWLLGDDPLFRSLVRYGDLCTCLEERFDDLAADTRNLAAQALRPSGTTGHARGFAA